MSERLAEHYRVLLLKYGDSAESAQYSSRETQERRFAQLIKIAPLDGRRVLDFGCGTGHLATYLKAQGVHVDYTGVDIVKEFFPVAQARHPDHRFGRLDEFSHESFDYIFIGGVFNNKRRDNRIFYQSCIRKLFPMSDDGVAFNMMSSYVDYRDKNLFYERPERAFLICQE